METQNKKRFLLASAVYLAVFLLILFVTNLGQFNDWLRKAMYLLRPVLIGLVLAYLLNPFFRFFERKLFYKIQPNPLRRCISLIFTYLTLFLIFALLLLLIVPQLVDSITNFIKEFDLHIDRTLRDANDIVTWLNEQLPKKENGVGMIPPINPETVKNSFTDLLNSLHLNSETLLGLININTIGTVVSLASNVVSLITDTIFGIFISLYFLNTKEKRYAQVMRLRRALFSDKVNDHITNICTTADKSFGGFLKGKILDSSIVGVLVYIAISLFGVPYAILIAAIVAITDIVPVIGPFIGVIPSAVIILLTEPDKVIPFVLCILVIQQIDGNILAPKVLGENTGVSSLCVIIAITTMGTLWGLAGMVLGVPLFATVLELTSAWLDKRLRNKGLPTDTDSYLSAERTVAEAANEGTVFERRQKKKAMRKQAIPEGGGGDLTAFEHFRLDTYALAHKYNLFTDTSEDALAAFAAEKATLAAKAEEAMQAEIVEEEASADSTEESLEEAIEGSVSEMTATEPKAQEPNIVEDEEPDKEV
ncbi:MAG: AI-2E family transporter [Clostridia bacterium]|nr:AI-2E family transporter [Clostridia bacterium]